MPYKVHKLTAVCYILIVPQTNLISVIMMRIIQFMIKKHPDVQKSDKLTWHEGLSAERVQKALNKFQIEEMAIGFY